jgi:hypothetical protein
VEFIPAVATLALIYKIVDFVRYSRARDFNGIVTQLVTWAAGVIVLLLVAQTTWAATVQVGNTPLSKLGVWSIVFAGVTVASSASLVKDAIKSIDNHDTAAVPTLLPANPGAHRR